MKLLVKLLIYEKFNAIIKIYQDIGQDFTFQCPDNFLIVTRILN